MVDVDTAFPDACFMVRDSAGTSQEFTLDQRPGRVNVSDQPIVRYVEFAEVKPRPGGAVRLAVVVVESWLS